MIPSKKATQQLPSIVRMFSFFSPSCRLQFFNMNLGFN